jgi:hypothetical protein
VLSGTGLCDGLITRPEESYRLWCVFECDLETSRLRRPCTALGRSATKKTAISIGCADTYCLLEEASPLYSFCISVPYLTMAGLDSRNILQYLIKEIQNIYIVVFVGS